MTFPLRQRFPVLTRTRLRGIQQQHGDDPVIRRLLWEIKCLQSIIMRAQQLEQSLHPTEQATERRIARLPARKTHYRNMAAEVGVYWDTRGKMQSTLVRRVPNFIPVEKSHAYSNFQKEPPTVDCETPYLDAQHHSNIREKSILT